MSKDDRHAEFEINFSKNNRIRISTDDCSLVTEYIEKDGVKRKTMGPTNIFFSAIQVLSSSTSRIRCATPSS